MPAEMASGPRSTGNRHRQRSLPHAAVGSESRPRVPLPHTLSRARYRTTEFSELVKPVLTGSDYARTVLRECWSVRLRIGPIPAEEWESKLLTAPGHIDRMQFPAG